MPDIQADRSLGRAIKQARVEKRMTQQALADLLGVHKMTVAKYEADQLPITVDRLTQIAAALSAPVINLMLEAGFTIDSPNDREGHTSLVEPDFLFEDPKTGERFAVELKGRHRSPEELAELRHRMSEALIGVIEIDESGNAVVQSNDPPSVVREYASEGYGSTEIPRLLRHLPFEVRKYLAEFRLRLTNAHVPDEEIDEAIELMKSPQLFTFYKGGVPSEYNEEEVLRGMKAIGEGVIIPELRERGRKIA